VKDAQHVASDLPVLSERPHGYHVVLGVIEPAHIRGTAGRGAKVESCPLARFRTAPITGYIRTAPITGYIAVEAAGFYSAENTALLKLMALNVIPCRTRIRAEIKAGTQRDEEVAGMIFSAGLGTGGVGWLVYAPGAVGFGIFLFVVAGIVGAFAMFMLSQTF
jgi:hypothetical protein